MEVMKDTTTTNADSGRRRRDGQSLKRFVYESLLTKLLNSELIPGQILHRRAVAEELGVSVAPVLEAMVQLESEGFLESIARKGTQVRPVGQKDIIGMIVIREALECEAARLYCGRKVRDAMEELLPLARALDTDATADPRHWNEELEFHSALVALADCRILSVEFNRCIHLNMFYGINRLYPRAGERGRMLHQELLRELTTEDPDAAEQAMRRHIRSGKGRLSELIR